jgi:hypothetical protein
MAEAGAPHAVGAVPRAGPAAERSHLCPSCAGMLASGACMLPSCSHLPAIMTSPTCAATHAKPWQAGNSSIYVENSAEIWTVTSPAGWWRGRSSAAAAGAQRAARGACSGRPWGGRRGRRQGGATECNPESARHRSGQPRGGAAGRCTQVHLLLLFGIQTSAPLLCNLALSAGPSARALYACGLKCNRVLFARQESG